MMNAPILFLHIAGGTGGLLSGAAAMALPKGGTAHARAGSLFFASMLLMTTAGAAIAIGKPDRITTVMGVFTFYLVLTAWVTVRRDGKAGGFERFAFAFGCAISLAYLAIGMAASRLPGGRIDGLPGAIAFVFGSVAALATALDLSFLIRGRLSARQRIARHLWRMLTALFIAAMSFFLGQQKVMPAFVRGSPLLFLPPLATLAAMAYWLVRLRLAGAARRLPWIRAIDARS
ncbi:MAG: hypothetical protein JWP15_3082 [Alphaproteobacteria bacterium]|nr:hypothetical protein [Alphaproteobacteria bacterium]